MKWLFRFSEWLLAAWIAAGSPAFASIPDPFRPVRVHVEEIQILYIPYVAFSLGTTTYDYDSRDNLTSASLPGGLSASYAYDNVNRLSSWSVSKAGSNLLARSCTRNGLGFRETETIQAGLETLDGPAAQTRQHNAADQITNIGQATPSSTNFPFFDAAGNTTQVVLSVKGQTFKTLCRYDYENRLLGVSRLRNNPQGQSVTTGVTQLEYDGQGLMLRITDNGVVRRLVRDRTDQLTRPLVETDASGNAVRLFVWSNDRLLAQVQSNGTIRIALSDELGRTVALSDSNGALTDEYAYQPYGCLIAHSGTTEIPFTWLASSGVWDAGHGLYLLRYRAYDANLARFGQVDPAGLAGGLNLYALANGSPLALIDPLGLCWEEPETWFAPTPSQTPTYNGPTLTSPYEISQQRQSSAFLGSLGTQINNPEIARGVASDLLFTVPTAVMGGVVDDAIRGAVSFLRGSSTAASQQLALPAGSGYNPWVGEINSVVGESDTVMYRVWGGESSQVGGWLSPTRPSSSLSAMRDFALPPGNSAQYVSEVFVPAGTRYQIGTAASAFGQPGGAGQVLLLDRIPAANFGQGVSIAPRHP